MKARVSGTKYGCFCGQPLYRIVEGSEIIRARSIPRRRLAGIAGRVLEEPVVYLEEFSEDDPT